jgi:hypothetical protein
MILRPRQVKRRGLTGAGSNSSRPDSLTRRSECEATGWASGLRSVVFLSLVCFVFNQGAMAQAREFESFKSITQKNIFDSTRRSPSATPARAEPPRPVPVDEFSYLGAILHERNAVAFFDGTDPLFKKALRTNETIAGFAITEIHLGYVKLRRDEEEMELPAGRRLTRRGDEPWSLAPISDGSPGGLSNQSQTERGRSGERSRPAEAPADADEILKRLMEQRNQEINR